MLDGDALPFVSPHPYDAYLKKGNPRKILDLYGKERLPSRIE